MKGKCISKNQQGDGFAKGFSESVREESADLCMAVLFLEYYCLITYAITQSGNLLSS